MPEKAIGNKNKKRGLKVAALAGGLVLVGGVAFAYWTQGGTGTGTAATGNTADITVNQTSTVANLAPGLSAQPLSGNFDNPNSGPVYVTSVTVSIASVDSTRDDHGLDPVATGQRAAVVLWTEDVRSAYAELVAAGVPGLKEPQEWLGRLLIAWLADPDGNPVQIVQPLSP